MIPMTLQMGERRGNALAPAPGGYGLMHGKPIERRHHA
jgi:hypothetical protein